jgi:hypothetical protein
MDLDTAGKFLTIVGGVVALGTAARAWYVNPSRQGRIKTDLEILTLLPKDSEQHEMVEHHVKGLIREEYGGLAELRAREMVWIILRCGIAVALGLWAWSAFSQGMLMWGAGASFIALALVAYSYIVYKLLPE